ncbi:MAG: RcnB family protein [Allosphingosinicella sp.]
MRKALLGILMAATTGMPIAAQAQDRDRTEGRTERAAARAERNAEHYREQGERNQARSEQRQQRQEVRQEVRVQRQEVQAPVRQQQQQTQQSWSGQRGGGDGQRGQRWGGGRTDSNREAYRQRVEETRAANQASIDQSIGGNYAREGRRNQANTEQQLRREYGIGQRDGRRDGNWSRDGRGDRYGDRRDSRRSSWNRSWRNDSRYDWQRYRYSNRNQFRIGNYYSPYRNYGYNRLSIGLILDSLFYSNRYWLNDPYQYRLPAAPYGTQWVRYYNDVVLVDVYTGEVIDVIYDFFW